MTKLEIVDRIDNEDTATRTLVVRDSDNPDDVGSMYHYAADPPKSITAEDWQRQTEAHALGLEARSRGVELPKQAAADPGALGRQQQQPAAPLSDDEQVELEQARSDRASADQAARDRAELEQLRAARQEQPSA